MLHTLHSYFDRRLAILMVKAKTSLCALYVLTHAGKFLVVSS